MNPINHAQAPQQNEQPADAHAANNPGIGDAQAAIHRGLADAAAFFNEAPDLAIKNTLSFFKKRGHEHFGEIAASSKRCKQIADSLITELNVPSVGIRSLIEKINAGGYKKLESLKLTGDINNRELSDVINALQANQIHLKKLDLSGCDHLTRLPDNLPRNLQTLDLSECYRLTQIPANLPEGLIELDASECYSMHRLPILPDSIERLYLNGCDGLERIHDPLPANLRILHMAECSSVDQLPPHLPTELVELNLQNCSDLGELPEQLPDTLRSLTIRGCESLTLLPEDLPEGLTINR